MSNQKRTISFQAPMERSEALSEIADTYNVSKSELMRSVLRRTIQEHEDILDEYMVLSAKITEEKTKARPFQSISHLPNNLHEQAREQIDKPYPIPPEEFAEEYYEPYKELISAKYEDGSDREGRAMAKLTHAMDMYYILHPSTDADPKEAKKAVLHYARSIVESKDGSLEDGKAFIKRRVADGIVSDKERDELYDKLREKQREKWQTEWQESIRANWG